MRLSTHTLAEWWRMASLAPHPTTLTLGRLGVMVRAVHDGRDVTVLAHYEEIAREGAVVVDRAISRANRALSPAE